MTPFFYARPRILLLSRRRLLVPFYCSIFLAAVGWLEWHMFRVLRHNNHNNSINHNINLSSDSSIHRKSSPLDHSRRSNSKSKPGGIQPGATAKFANDQNQRVVQAPPKNKPQPPQKKETSVHVKKPPPRPYTDAEYNPCPLLRRGDIVHTYGPWDGSPIVLESHQLLFFTIPKVGCTVWKQLFRRMEGYKDWIQDQHPLPHAPPRNGLKYLYDYEPIIAEHMLTDPSWTRAIFVRDPKERLLSAYLDKGRQNQYIQFHCCKHLQPQEGLYRQLQCDHPQEHRGPTESLTDSTPPLLSFSDFVSSLVHHCPDPHWNPQSQRIDAKYWPYVNFVGRMERMERDAQQLLQLIGAWEEYGTQGWPPQGRIFAGTDTVSHVTDSSNQLTRYFSTDVERVVDPLLQNEYNHSVLGFQPRRISIASTE